MARLKWKSIFLRSLSANSASAANWRFSGVFISASLCAITSAAILCIVGFIGTAFVELPYSEKVTLPVVPSAQFTTLSLLMFLGGLVDVDWPIFN